MTHLGFASPEDPVPMPKVERACTICGPSDEEIRSGRVIVSPTGVAHHADGDKTNCGKDATPDGWWWPL